MQWQLQRKVVGSLGAAEPRSSSHSPSSAAAQPLLQRPRLTADVAHFDLAQFRGFGRADFAVAICADLPQTGEQRGDVIVAGAVTQERAEIHTVIGEQAGVNFAVGGEASSRAGVAKGLRDAGDDADFAPTVGRVDIAPALSDFTRVMRINGLERMLGVNRDDELAITKSSSNK